MSVAEPEEVATAEAMAEAKEEEQAEKKETEEAPSKKTSMAMLETEPEEVAMMAMAWATEEGQLKAMAMLYAKAEEEVAISEVDEPEELAAAEEE